MHEELTDDPEDPADMQLDGANGHKRKKKRDDGQSLSADDDGLDSAEVKIIRSVLDMKSKNVKSIMTSIENTFMLGFEDTIDRTVFKQITDVGHSRIPVYMRGDKSTIVGMLLVKSLLLCDPDDSTPVSSLPIRRMPVVSEKQQLFDLLRVFQGGRAHMAVVISAVDCLTVVGVVTLEDVIEELIGREIYDEADQERDAKASSISSSFLPLLTTSTSVTSSTGAGDLPDGGSLRRESSVSSVDASPGGADQEQFGKYIQQDPYEPSENENSFNGKKSLLHEKDPRH